MRKNQRSAIAMNIHEHSKRSGVSQQELAAGAGLSQPAMSRRMNGEVEFRVDELQAIAAFLEVPLEQLLAPADPVEVSA